MKRKRSDDIQEAKKKRLEEVWFLTSSKRTLTIESSWSPMLVEALAPIPATPMTGPSKPSKIVWPASPTSLIISSRITRSPRWSVDVDISISAWKENLVLHKELKAIKSAHGNSKLVKELLDIIFLLIDRNRKHYDSSKYSTIATLRFTRYFFIYFIFFWSTSFVLIFS